MPAVSSRSTSNTIQLYGFHASCKHKPNQKNGNNNISNNGLRQREHSSYNKKEKAFEHYVTEYSCCGYYGQIINGITDIFSFNFDIDDNDHEYNKQLKTRQTMWDTVDDHRYSNMSEEKSDDNYTYHCNSNHNKDNVDVISNPSNFYTCIEMKHDKINHQLSFWKNKKILLSKRCDNGQNYGTFKLDDKHVYLPLISSIGCCTKNGVTIGYNEY